MHFKGYIFHGYQTFTRFDRETVELEFYNKRHADKDNQQRVGLKLNIARGSNALAKM